MTSKTRALSLWLPPVLWAAGIFYLSSIPGLQSGTEFDFILRKGAHMTEYFVLTALLHRAFNGSFALGSVARRLWPAAAAVAYAATDELHQLFVADRHGSMLDVLIDAAGVAIFYFVLKLLGEKKSGA